MRPENTRPGCCGKASEGTLPGKCAGMVFPYVPMQCQNPERYGQKEGLSRGTLFPGLDMPFYKEIKSRANCDDQALCELMALGFAINEMGLYLDTHKDDREALALYLSYVDLAREGRKRYEEAYGPLRQTSVTESGWKWLNDPWPWDYEGGRK